MSYMSPGASASGAMEQFLLQHDAKIRQAKLDAMEVQKVAHAQKMDEAKLSLEREALQERRDVLASQMDDKDAGRTQKTVDSMVEGDIPDPLLVSRAQKHGIRLPLRAQAPAPLPGTMSMQSGQPVVPQDAPQGIASPDIPQVYQGSKQEVLKKADDTRAESYINSLPVGPMRDAALYELRTGRNPPANTTKPGSIRLLLDPRKGVYKDPTTGAQVTDEARINAATIDRMSDPQASNGAAEGRRATQLQHAYDAAMKEVNDRSKPIEGHLQGIDELGGMLDMHSPQADTLIAPLILKATVSGQGSGFRMTRAEIDNVLHGRSKWEDLKAAMQKWSTDPSKANSLTPDQREQMRDLAKDLRRKAGDLLGKVSAIRDQIDESTDPVEIKKLRSKLQKTLGEQPAATAATTMKRKVYDINGNLVSGGQD